MEQVVDKIDEAVDIEAVDIEKVEGEGITGRGKRKAVESGGTEGGYGDTTARADFL